MKEFEVSEDYNLIEEEVLQQYQEYEEEACLRTEGLVLFRDSFFNLFNSDGQSKLDMVIGILTIVSVMLMLIILIFSF